MSDYNSTTWAQAFLTDLGDTPNSENMADVELWEAAEGGAGPQWGTDNLANYNPINTTLGEPGSTSINTDDVQSYENWDEGLAANVDTLEENQRGYAQIQAALAQGLPPGEFAPIVQASAWGTNDINKVAQEDGYQLNYQYATGMAYENEPVTPGINLSTADPAQQSDQALLNAAGDQQVTSPFNNTTASANSNSTSYIIGQDLQNIMSPQLSGGIVNQAEQAAQGIVVHIALGVVGLVIIIAGLYLIFKPMAGTAAVNIVRAVR